MHRPQTSTRLVCLNHVVSVLLCVCACVCTTVSLSRLYHAVTNLLYFWICRIIKRRLLDMFRYKIHAIQYVQGQALIWLPYLLRKWLTSLCVYYQSCTNYILAHNCWTNQFHQGCIVGYWRYIEYQSGTLGHHTYVSCTLH